MDPITLSVIVNAILTIISGLFATIGVVAKLRYDAKVAAQAQQIAGLQAQNTSQATQIAGLNTSVTELQAAKGLAEQRLAEEREHCDARLSAMEQEIRDLRKAK